MQSPPGEVSGVTKHKYIRHPYASITWIRFDGSVHAPSQPAFAGSPSLAKNCCKLSLAQDNPLDKQNFKTNLQNRPQTARIARHCMPRYNPKSPHPPQGKVGGSCWVPRLEADAPAYRSPETG